MAEVTQLLKAIENGGPVVSEKLLPLVYDELRKVAAVKMAGEPAGHTLQATALVHEAWLRLAQESRHPWCNRQQFFAVATEIMRRILVDRARRRQSRKHGGGLERFDIEAVEIPMPADDDLILRVHAALDQLAVEDPQKAEVVKLRFFVGLSHQEIAAMLDLNEKTVRRHWSFAKAWLVRAMKKE